MTGRRPLSGRQYTLRHGRYEAAVASVGASLRRLRHDDRDLVVPFAADEVRPAHRGLTLAPWPNRVADARFTFAGLEHRLPVTEPDRGNALHGLAHWLDFESVRDDEHSVVLVATIEAQSGYPWRVRVQSAYTLAGDGLTQQVRATNLSDHPAPFGTGPHPYLVAGAAPLDSWALTLPARQVLTVTDDRLLPQRLVGVAEDGGRLDFREPRVLGDTTIDHAFTELLRDPDGLATVRLTSPEGTGVTMTWGAACAWVQIHTADLPGGAGTAGHRAGLAVEPMTCAPDAFNAAAYAHDTGLWVLEPGGSATAAWTLASVW